MAELTVITVEHRCVDGWHVFTSDDVYGLYVANPDPVKAIEDVIPSVKLLLKLNEDIECDVIPTTRFKKFVAAAKAAAEPESIPHPAVFASQQYVLQKKAA